MGLVLKGLAAQTLALLAVVALLASAVGPMLDHHFAERHPAHGHLYLGAADRNHSHPFEHSHVHYDALYAPAPGHGGTLFFASYDASGHSHADIAAPAALSSPPFGDDGGPLLGGRGYSASLLPGLHVSPLIPPPKA